MPQARKQGEKFATNFVKVVIMLFLRDKKRETSDIREFLEKEFGITNSKGVRNHLYKLEELMCITANRKSGIGTHWEWQKDPDHFKEVIKFFCENNSLVEKVIDDSITFQKLGKEARTYRIGLSYFESNFDVTRLWFNTKFTSSFLNKKTLDHFVNKAYSKYNKTEKDKNLDRRSFEKAIFSQFTIDQIIVFMHYSPSLFSSIFNLENNYEDMIKESNRLGFGHLFLTVLGDSLIKHFDSHGEIIPMYSFKEVKDSPKEYALDITCILRKPVEMKNANS